jgi:hypothetical protein
MMLSFISEVLPSSSGHSNHTPIRLLDKVLALEIGGKIQNFETQFTGPSAPFHTRLTRSMVGAAGGSLGSGAC